MSDYESADTPRSQYSYNSAQITSGLLSELRKRLGWQSSQSFFACGGAIPIQTAEPDSTPKEPLSAVSSAPITLRWDPASKDAPAREARLTFPLDAEAGPNLERLVRDTEPATFGQGREEVYDEAYRKATKMNPTQFCSTFNPYELGIIDTIAQVLLPHAASADAWHIRSVRAELYKLNVYSGPRGRFRAHVDTPRSASQFGSLVVCLPTEHEGGELRVAHQGREMLYDWSSSSARGDDDARQPAVRWAAFYSDVEHEVLEVRSGHRVTLTYNLYAVRGGGLLAGECPALDPAYLPLHDFAKRMLEEEEFMVQGGHLGFFCTHAYAHTDTDRTILPDMLKGVDMVVWQTFASLGLDSLVRPVIDVEEGQNEGRHEGRIVGGSLRRYFGGFEEDGTDLLEDFLDESIDPEGVYWLNGPGNKEPQIDYIAYGNQPSTAELYSYCAIVIEVPRSAQRLFGNAVDADDVMSGTEVDDGEAADGDADEGEASESERRGWTPSEHPESQ